MGALAVGGTSAFAVDEAGLDHDEMTEVGVAAVAIDDEALGSRRAANELGGDALLIGTGTCDGLATVMVGRGAAVVWLANLCIADGVGSLGLATHLDALRER